MLKLSRRETLARSGQVAAAVAMTTLPTTALGASNDDAALVDMEKELSRIVDEINAALHSLDGDICDEVWDRRCDLVDDIADTPACGLEGVAVKLRMAAFQIGEIAGAEWTTEHDCVLTALETVKRLADRRVI